MTLSCPLPRPRKLINELWIIFMEEVREWREKMIIVIVQMIRIRGRNIKKIKGKDDLKINKKRMRRRRKD